MWCPKCRTEYQKGFSVCSDCGSKLVKTLPPKRKPVLVDLVTVATAYGQAEAEVIKAKLESENIPVCLKYEAVQVVYGFKLDGLGKVEIQVPDSLASKARQVLGNKKAT